MQDRQTDRHTHTILRFLREVLDYKLISGVRIIGVALLQRWAGGVGLHGTHLLDGGRLGVEEDLSAVEVDQALGQSAGGRGPIGTVLVALVSVWCVCLCVCVWGGGGGGVKCAITKRPQLCPEIAHPCMCY